MSEIFIANENLLRMSVFLGVFITMMVLEAVFPRKKRTIPRRKRWVTNLAIIFADTVAVRFLVPILAVGVAAYASVSGWGLFNIVEAPIWLEIILSIIILDMLIYWQHVAFHFIPPLWALHKVHHVDRDIDVTTGIRFHPLEILISMGYKFACLIVLGVPVVAIILFEILLNASAMFNHANMRLPLKVDRVLRLFIVTPDMHRVHHSIIEAETNSNYGFNLSLWDRIFGSYIPQPQDGHDGMTIGLEEYQTEKPARFWWSMALPFLPKPEGK